MNIHIYIYTHKKNQNSPTKIKYNRLIWRSKETKNYIYQNKTNQITNLKTKLNQGTNWGIKQRK